MYSAIALALIGLGVGLWLTNGDGYGRSVFWTVIISLVGIVIGGFIGIAIAAGIGVSGAKVQKVYGPATLVSIRSSDGVNGAFIWGSGSIGSETSYNFMLKLDDGSLTPRKVPSNSLVFFIQDPELKDIGYWRTTVEVDDLTSPKCTKWSWGICSPTETYIRQEFRVPAGTIVEQFSVK